MTALECWDCDATLDLPDVGERQDELRVDVPCPACGFVHALTYDPEFVDADGQPMPWRIVGFTTRANKRPARGRRRKASIGRSHRRGAS